MKILRVELIAFGPFSGTELDLAGGHQGLHIIYGPNEAGKSSALRALEQMLYGVPVRSPDDFVHPYTRMRIGATLAHSDGTRLSFIRRKGRLGTLRDANDQEALEDTALEKFLGAVDNDLFTAMFGIGHDDLVRGGREIIQGGGDLGPAIFAAGVGIAGLREIRADFESRADALFKPSGQKPQVNLSIAAFHRNRKALRELQLPGAAWVRHDRALNQARTRKRTIDDDLAVRETQRHRLKRIREALPAIARRKELLADLQPYADAVLLPTDFGERRRELTTGLNGLVVARDQAKKRIADLKQALSTLEISMGLVENAESVETLYQELGSHRKAAADRVGLITRNDMLRGEARDRLRNLKKGLTLDEAQQLHIQRNEIVRIQALGEEYQKLTARLKSAHEDIPRLQSTLEDIKQKREALDPSLPPEGLQQALEAAMGHSSLEKHCRNEGREIDQARASLRRALDRQTTWSGPLEALEGLPVPSLETIDTFSKRMKAAEADLSDLESEIQHMESIRAEAQKELQTLRLVHNVPTEDDLAAARRLRDQGWRSVRGTLENSAPSKKATADFMAKLTPAGTLAEAYEESVRRADEVVDRLRREADRVAANGRLQAELAATREQYRRLQPALDRAGRKLSAISDDWAAVWKPAGIAPLTPREMRSWTQDHQARAAQAADIRIRQANVDGLRSEIAAQRLKLGCALESLGQKPAAAESLAQLITRGRRLLERQASLRNTKEKLLAEYTQRKTELADTRLQVETAENALAQWQKDWKKAVGPLGLGPDAIPAQANAVIEELRDLFDTLKQASLLKSRIKGIDRDAKTFSGKVKALTERLTPDLRHLPPDQAVVELSTRLNRSREAMSRQLALEQQRQQEQKQLDAAIRQISETHRLLDGMCRDAGCASHETLDQAEKRSNERRRLEDLLSRIEDQLRRLSGGDTVDDFLKETARVNPDGIDIDIVRLDEAIDTLIVEKSGLDQTIGREMNELSKMDGSARAADLAEEIEGIKASLDRDVVQYTRLRLASVVLNRTIERYREKNQGPILTRSSELFCQLTSGSFAGIRADVDEKGNPVMVGVRPDGTRTVGVEGMSDGTADQLYLALRLASLESYLTKAEPLPFIVDDILIRFDDQRATSTLSVLADLSRQTQVIFFTHHQHLVDLASAHLDAGILHLHTLNI